MPVSFDVKNVPVLKAEDVRNLGVAEVRDRLKDAAQKAHELWTEFKNTDGRLSEDEVIAIRTLNDNMSILKQRDEEFRELEKYLSDGSAEYKRHTQPQRPTGMFGADNQSATAPELVGKSIGDLFVESVAFKNYDASNKRSPSAEIENAWQVIRKQRLEDTRIKALLDTTGFAPETTRTGLIVPGALRRPTVADLIPGGTTTQNAIVYMEETTTTNAAAPTAEGGVKPESALAFTERTSNVRKIATTLPVTDELFQDAPAMRDYINARLETFMLLAEEDQLIDGSGVSPELTGMLNHAGIQTQAQGTDPIPDAIFRAITKVQVGSFLEADGVIFNPLDWQEVRLLRTTDGIYIWGSPAEAGPARIWGLPVVATTAMPENTVIVAAFGTAMQIFRRSGIEFAVSSEHADFFIRNQLMIRAEERLAFVVYRPSAICTVTLAS